LNIKCLIISGLVACTCILTVNAFYSSSNVIKLTSINFNSQVIQSDKLWLVKFYVHWCEHCEQFVPEWNKVATALKGIVKVGAIDVTKYTSIGRQYEIEEFPTIKFFGPNKNKAEKYYGGRSSASITNGVLNSIRFIVRERLIEKGSLCGSGGQCRRIKNKDAFELNDNNFDNQVARGDEIWIVEFYAPWCEHCLSQEPEWTNAVIELTRRTKGMVHLAAVDTTINEMLASRYGIQQVPVIKIFQKNKEAVDYNDEKSASSIIATGLDLYAKLPPYKPFEYWMSKNFLQLNIGKTKAIVFGLCCKFRSPATDSIPLPGHCLKLNQTVRNLGVLFDPEMSFRPHIRSITKTAYFHLPLIRGNIREAFTLLPTSMDIAAASLESAADRYLGSTRNQSTCQASGYPHWDTTLVEHRKQHQAAQVQTPGEAASSSSQLGTSFSVPSESRDPFAEYEQPTISSDIGPQQMVSEEVLKTTCDSQLLCIIAILPRTFDTGTSDRSDYLGVLVKMADKYKKRKWGWLWTESGAQPRLETALGIGGLVYPTVVAINARRTKYVLMKGSFNERGIAAFFRKLSTGHVSRTPISDVFPKVKTVKRWDGKEGELPKKDPIISSGPSFEELENDEL
ncbi:protein disulfide-isomerase A6-like, partial [Heptranchias perlo]|uniref:protein disulfide-isomerase A6-like n=1 Tax=Heptranchias perlo TaxID=212740 RepID=UPI0035594A3E